MPKNVFVFSSLFNPNTWYSSALVFPLWCPKINWRLSLKSFSKYLVVMVSLWKTNLIRGAAWSSDYLLTIGPLFKTRLGRNMNEIFFLNVSLDHIFFDSSLYSEGLRHGDLIRKWSHHEEASHTWLHGWSDEEEASSQNIQTLKTRS